MMSRAADCENFDSTCVRDQGRLWSYCRRIEELDLFYSTLTGVEVSCGDCRGLLQMYAQEPKAFVYLDPPYTPEEMSWKERYREYSWTIEDHEELVSILLSPSMRAYDNHCYEKLVDAGWIKIFLEKIHVSSSGSSRRSDEYVWTNFKIPSWLLEDVSQLYYKLR